MMEFGDVFNFGTKSRVSCHNHITGLGLNKETGEVLPNSTCGLIGQESARMVFVVFNRFSLFFIIVLMKNIYHHYDIT